MTARRTATHPYMPAGPPDHRGQQPCACGLPRTNRAHDLPDTDPDTTAAEQRRLGEHEGDQ